MGCRQEEKHAGENSYCYCELGDTNLLAFAFTSPLMTTVRPGPMEEFSLAMNGRVWKESRVGPRKPAEWDLVGKLSKHWGVFKDRDSEPHGGTARICLGPRWVPNSNCAWLTASSEMSGCGAGPHTLHLSETHSEETCACGLEHCSRSAEGKELGTNTLMVPRQSPDNWQLSGDSRKMRGGAVSSYWG